MKKTLIAVLALISISAFAYDGNLLARNCVGANINEDQLSLVKNELSDIGARFKVKKNPTGYTDYRVIAIGRNGMVTFDNNLHFKMNKKIRNILASTKLRDEGIDFRITSVGECIEFSK